MNEIMRDFLMSQKGVKAAIEAAHATILRAMERREDTARFLVRYAFWNSVFGSCVASLAGRIGQSFAFREADLPEAIADRSVLVASYIFDAARDEFDDGATPHRDTHRCLAQACVNAAIGVLCPADERDAMMTVPSWLGEHRSRVATGYCPVDANTGTHDSADHSLACALFEGIGFHLGSELLADREFTHIDGALRKKHEALVHELSSTTVRIADADHNAYQWISIHAGGGGAVEADHFAWALNGLAHAFRFSKPSVRSLLLDATLTGFRRFVAHHTYFFQNVLA